MKYRMTFILFFHLFIYLNVKHAHNSMNKYLVLEECWPQCQGNYSALTQGVICWLNQ